jgi:hypothetical protein
MDKVELRLSPSLWSAKAFLGMCQIRLGAIREGQDLLESSVAHVPDNNLRNQAGLELIIPIRNLMSTGVDWAGE